jgi:SpoVK/Ycf46/Vps4 family AAA+-type ATPase
VIPTPKERAVMLAYLTERTLLKMDNVDTLSLASQAHAFMASNLAQWCRLAEEKAIQESCSKGKY